MSQDQRGWSHHRHGTATSTTSFASVDGGVTWPETDESGLYTDAEDMSFTDYPTFAGRPPRLEIGGSVTSAPSSRGGHFTVNNEKEQLITTGDRVPYTVGDLPAFDPEGNVLGSPDLGGSRPSSTYSRSGPYHCHIVRTHASAKATKQLIIVSCLCTLFLAAELTGGLISNSLALVTDATHMASDLSSFLVGLFAIWVAKKPATERMSFGFYRAEVLGALVSVLIIWVTTGILLYLAVGRIIDDDYEIQADDMLITAGLGVAFNIVMMLVLNSGSFNIAPSFGHNHSHGGHGHSHGGHGHSHGGQGHGGHGGNNDILVRDPHENLADQRYDAYGPGYGDSQTLGASHQHSLNGETSVERQVSNSGSSTTADIQVITGANGNVSHRDSFVMRRRATFENSHQNYLKQGRPVKEPTNINVRAAFIHAIGDFIQSIGVLIAAYIIKYKPEYKVADPICTFVFSLLVLCTTIAILRDALAVLMEGAPKDFRYKDAKRDLRHLGGVLAVHSLHVWALTIDKTALAVHIAVSSDADRDVVLRDATSLLREQYKVHSSTIQIEAYEEDIMSSCEQCTGPNASV